METPTDARVECAGGIVFDPDGRLLLIRRANPPAAGRWSIPGGRCEPGEAPAVACRREVGEETGLDVEVIRFAGRVDRAGPSGIVFDIYDFVCAVVGGTLAAGDDATDVRWASRDDLGSLDLAPGLVEALEGWNTVPN